MSSVSKDKLSLIKGLSKTAPAFVPASSGAVEDLTKLPPLPDMSNVPVMKVSSDTITSPVNKKKVLANKDQNRSDAKPKSMNSDATSSTSSDDDDKDSAPVMIPQMSYPAVEVEMYDPNGNYIRMVTALLPSGALYPPPPGFKFIRVVGPSPVRMSTRPLPGMPMPGMPMPGMVMSMPGMPIGRAMPGMPMPGMPMPGMPMAPMTGMPMPGMPGMPASNTTQSMTGVSKPITFRAPRSDDEVDSKKQNEKSEQKQALVSNSRQPIKETEKKRNETDAKGMTQKTTRTRVRAIDAPVILPSTTPISYAKAAAKPSVRAVREIDLDTTEPEKVDAQKFESEKPEMKKPETKKSEVKKTESKKVEPKKSESKNDSKTFKNDKINFTPAEKRGQKKEIASLGTVVSGPSTHAGTPSASTGIPKTSIRPRPSPPVAEKPLVIDDAFDFESLFAEENTSAWDSEAVPATSIQMAMSQRQKSAVRAANAPLLEEGVEMSDAVALLVALGFDAEENSEKSFHELLETVQSTAEKMTRASQVDEMTQQTSSDAATMSKIALFGVSSTTSKLTQKAADEKAREEEIERQAALDIQRAKEQLQAVNAVLQPRQEELFAENTQHRAEKIRTLLKEQKHEISDDTIMDLVLRDDATNVDEEQRNVAVENDVETDDLNIIDGWRFLGDAEDKVRRDAISRTAFLRRVKKARARGDDVRPIIDAEIARRNRLSGFVAPKEDQNKNTAKISQKTKQERNATKSNPFSSLAF